MIPLTLAELAVACGGRLEGDPQVLVSGVTTDSRSVQPGDLFLGLRGERFDGDAYAAAALVAGAAAVVVRAETAVHVPRGCSRIVVDDGLVALQRIARAVRLRLPARVVGVTGSAGKTSTKDILTALLRPVARVTATYANLNNEIGLPLTVLAASPETEVLVVEMGMRGFGQIRELARIALPEIGVITSVAPVHLEAVGTLAGVAAAKAELIEELGEGTAVLPASEPLLQEHARGTAGAPSPSGSRGATFARSPWSIARARRRRSWRPSAAGSGSPSGLPAGTTSRTPSPPSPSSSSSGTRSRRPVRAPPGSSSATSAARLRRCVAAGLCSTTRTTPTPPP